MTLSQLSSVLMSGVPDVSFAGRTVEAPSDKQRTTGGDIHVPDTGGDRLELLTAAGQRLEIKAGNLL